MPVNLKVWFADAETARLWDAIAVSDAAVSKQSGIELVNALEKTLGQTLVMCISSLVEAAYRHGKRVAQEEKK
jgi:hypothetical protein